MSEEVLTIKEVVALLKLAEKTFHTIANAGELPIFKIRGHWRVMRVELDKWIDGQPRGVGEERDGKAQSRVHTTAKRRDGATGKKNTATKNGNGSAAVVGFNPKLRRAAYKLHKNLEAVEYKNVVLGLFFLSKAVFRRGCVNRAALKRAPI